MSIWSVASVDREPEIGLRRWRVMETERGEHHFVGQCVASNTGRVSSAIVSFDRQSRTGRTRSGRRYTLIGDPGDDPDGMHTWSIWVISNNVTRQTNVSSQYLALGDKNDAIAGA